MSPQEKESKLQEAAKEVIFGGDYYPSKKYTTEGDLILKALVEFAKSEAAREYHQQELNEVDVESLKNKFKLYSDNGGNSEYIWNEILLPHLQPKQESDAVKWVLIKDKLPLCYKTGNWDGQQSDQVLIEYVSGGYDVAVLYEGFIDGSNYSDWYDTNGLSIVESIKQWRKI